MQGYPGMEAPRAPQPARNTLPQICLRGKKAGASSPRPKENQIDLPVLLYFSLSLISLNPFHGADFHSVLEINFDLFLVTGRESRSQNSKITQFLGAAVLDWNCCVALGESLCFSVPTVFPSGKTLLESPLMSHTWCQSDRRKESWGRSPVCASTQR